MQQPFVRYSEKNKMKPQKSQLTIPVQFQIVSLKQSQTPQGLEDLSVLSVLKILHELWQGALKTAMISNNSL